MFTWGEKYTCQRKYFPSIQLFLSDGEIILIPWDNSICDEREL